MVIFSEKIPVAVGLLSWFQNIFGQCLCNAILSFVTGDRIGGKSLESTKSLNVKNSFFRPFEFQHGIILIRTFCASIYYSTSLLLGPVISKEQIESRLAAYQECEKKK